MGPWRQKALDALSVYETKVLLECRMVFHTLGKHIRLSRLEICENSHEFAVPVSNRTSSDIVHKQMVFHHQADGSVGEMIKT